MENASKALLIAGAILIAILLIGIGMMVFGNISGVTSGATKKMDAMAIQIFNDPFSQYAGTNVTGSNVKALINMINANNKINTADGGHTIYYVDTINDGTELTSGTSNKSVNEYTTTKRYTVTFGTDKNGFYNQVSIKITSTT